MRAHPDIGLTTARQKACSRLAEALQKKSLPCSVWLCVQNYTSLLFRASDKYLECSPKYLDTRSVFSCCTKIKNSVLLLIGFVLSKSVQVGFDMIQSCTQGWVYQTRCKVGAHSNIVMGSYRGIFVMRDRIISFTEKRDFKNIFFVIRDAHISRDT